MWSSLSSDLSSGDGGSGGGSGGGSLGEGNESFCSFSSSAVGSFLLLLCQPPVGELSPPSIPFTLQNLVDLLSSDSVGGSSCCCCLSSELLGWFPDSSAFIIFSINFQFPIFCIIFISVFIPASHV